MFVVAFIPNDIDITLIFANTNIMNMATQGTYVDYEVSWKNYRTTKSIFSE